MLIYTILITLAIRYSWPAFTIWLCFLGLILNLAKAVTKAMASLANEEEE